MKNLIYTLKNILFAIPRPEYWTMNNSYCPEWDAELNHLLDNFQMREERFFTLPRYVVLGAQVVWVENHPYAQFTPEYNLQLDRQLFLSRVRLSRLTIHRANQILKEFRTKRLSRLRVKANNRLKIVKENSHESN